MRAVRAELAKLVTLPATWVAVLLGLVVPSGVGILAGSGAGPGVDTGYQDLAFGVVGAVVLGVVAISSEYTSEGAEAGGGRQITSSLTVVPARLRLLAAKAAALVLVTAALGVLTCVARFSTIGAADAGRLGGVVVYWVLTALLAFGFTLLTRNGIVPLAVMIANSSLVSVTYLVARGAAFGGFLPDMAGVRMFIRELDISRPLAPVTGGLVMAGWAGVLLAAGAVAFTRRDA